MISRVVVVRHLGGLLRAVGLMVSLFKPFFVTFLGELSSESTWLQQTVNSSFTKECQNGDSTKPDSTPRSLSNTVGFQANHHNKSICVSFMGKLDTPSFVSGLNAWIVVLVLSMRSICKP